MGITWEGAESVMFCGRPIFMSIKVLCMANFQKNGDERLLVHHLATHCKKSLIFQIEKLKMT